MVKSKKVVNREMKILTKYFEEILGLKGDVRVASSFILCQTTTNE